MPLTQPRVNPRPGSCIPLLSLGEVCADCTVVCLEWSQLAVRPSQGSQTGRALRPPAGLPGTVFTRRSTQDMGQEGEEEVVCPTALRNWELPCTANRGQRGLQVSAGAGAI